MASTYSNLKIQLMTAGENNQTWNNVTNVNLGTTIEEAIVGSADVTFASANVTLTLTDTNATQTARNMRLNCTGTTGGSSRNLVLPAIEKPYIIYNGCADSIVAKNATGTGITIPAGKSMWVYNDATNVVDVVTHLTTLTLGTALPVAQGGTGANTASDARTNLGLGTMSTQAAGAVAITGGTVTGITDLAVADGGTGASSAADARTNLGLGTMSTQAAGAVAITGGTVTGITDLAVADGGTGASTAAGARTNLDVPTRGGTDATGTWGISISGTAATATSATSATSATTATYAGTVTGTALAIGYLQIPQSTNTTAAIGDVGKHILQSSNVTIPASVFSAGDAFSIVNSSSSSITVVQGSSVTLRWAGTSSTGNRTLAGYGMVSVLCVASNTFMISGAGLS